MSLAKQAKLTELATLDTQACSSLNRELASSHCNSLHLSFQPIERSASQARTDQALSDIHPLLRATPNSAAGVAASNAAGATARLPPVLLPACKDLRYGAVGCLVCLPNKGLLLLLLSTRLYREQYILSLALLVYALCLVHVVESS